MFIGRKCSIVKKSDGAEGLKDWVAEDALDLIALVAEADVQVFVLENHQNHIVERGPAQVEPGKHGDAQRIFDAGKAGPRLRGAGQGFEAHAVGERVADDGKIRAGVQ